MQHSLSLLQARYTALLAGSLREGQQPYASNQPSYCSSHATHWWYVIQNKKYMMYC
jgi:hypothetical protein